MKSLLTILDMVLDLYSWVIIISAVLSWLVTFGVVNTRNRFVAVAGDVLFRLTEPALRQVRRVIPSVQGVDLSPIALLLLIYFVRLLLREYGGL